MFTKEADLRDYLATHPETVSAGCSLIGKEVDLDGDRLDLMLWSQTVSVSGRPLYGLYVVELKLGKLSDGDLAQVLTYARIVQEASCQYCFDATYKNPGWYRDRPTALRRWENAVGFGDEESCIITPIALAIVAGVCYNVAAVRHGAACAGRNRIAEPCPVRTDAHTSVRAGFLFWRQGCA